MSTLWKKEWVDTDAEILAFTVGDDTILDAQLLPYDIIGSLAHAKGLARIGILNPTQYEALASALQALYRDWKEGRFTLGPEDEDMHSALERALTDKLGETGERIHTGRSRNDQVLTALRLYMKAELLDTMGQLTDLVRLVCDSGARYRHILMPGYTHLQRAMPSTVAFWYASFAEAWTDTLEAGQHLTTRLDRSPLGAAAGFGVPLPLDRTYTAELMGFKAVQVNAAAVQNSRGRLESALVGWLYEIGRDVEKLAWDLLLFSSSEFDFAVIPETLCTGSSIMPQKKNPDVLELLRAAPTQLRAARDEIDSTIAKLPSNYHRDFQSTKGPCLSAVKKCHTLLTISGKVIEGISWKTKQLERACSPELFATHRAMKLVRDGTAFRKAYKTAATELHNGRGDAWHCDPGAVIDGLGHLGAPGNPGLDEARQRAETIATWIDTTRTALHAKWEKLLAL